MAECAPCDWCAWCAANARCRARLWLQTEREEEIQRQERKRQDAEAKAAKQAERETQQFEEAQRRRAAEGMASVQRSSRDLQSPAEPDSDPGLDSTITEFGGLVLLGGLAGLALGDGDTAQLVDQGHTETLPDLRAEEVEEVEEANRADAGLAQEAQDDEIIAEESIAEEMTEEEAELDEPLTIPVASLNEATSTSDQDRDQDRDSVAMKAREQDPLVAAFWPELSELTEDPEVLELESGLSNPDDLDALVLPDDCDDDEFDEYWSFLTSGNQDEESS